MAWCELPISWNRKREGFRSPPKLAAGDATKILTAADLADHDDLDDLANDLDEALSDLDDARTTATAKQLQTPGTASGTAWTSSTTLCARRCTRTWWRLRTRVSRRS
jgi:hypothetical protein